MNWTPDMNDVYKMLRLPQRIAEEKGRPYHVILEDFHNLMFVDGYEDVFKLMEELFSEAITAAFPFSTCFKPKL